LAGVVVAKGLVKEFERVTAVAGIDFEVRAGECFGFLGPNGAGKSTTLRMIHCFLPPTAGHLEILGLAVPGQCRRIKRHLGVVPQENNIDPELKVLESLLVYARFFDLTRAEAIERAGELMAFFGLEGKENERPDNLSGGMKRRLTIARALINKPQLLLLDEPTTGLDPQARYQVWQRLFRLKEEGVTLILTTHYMEEAAQLCDRLVIMESGAILASGEPEQLVADHTGREVVIVGDGALRPDEVEAVAGNLYRDKLVLGQDLFLYTNSGPELLAALGNLGFPRLVLRPATLEDVYLRLTGKGLEE